LISLTGTTPGRLAGSSGVAGLINVHELTTPWAERAIDVPAT
jgi:hypothetical protein